jgi:hypothetical protein
MRRITVCMAILALGVVAWGTGPASAQSKSATYQWILLGTEEGGPNVAIAANGATVEMTGEGTLSVHHASASGGGGFTQLDPNGNVVASGTWVANGLSSFGSYGTIGDNLYGGQAVLSVTLTPDSGGSFSGVLWVTCLVGNPPAGMEEGIRLNALGINYNKADGGDTIFILQ